MMPPLSRRILETWLETAVPASLDDMVDYQKALALVHEFACRLDILKWPGSERFHDWVSSAPRIWLNKRRETALDWTRNQISLGIGMPVLVERVETQLVAREEAKELVAATAGSEVSIPVFSIGTSKYWFASAILTTPRYN
jgi:centromere/kinetochore protein ZW10